MAITDPERQQGEILARIPTTPKIEMRSSNPFAFGVGATDPDYFKDPVILNGMLEKVGEGKMLMKRPGYATMADLWPSIVPHGIYNYRASFGEPSQTPFAPRELLLVAVDSDLLIDPEASIRTGEDWKDLATSVWAASTSGFTTFVQFTFFESLLLHFAMVSNRGGLTQVYSSSNNGVTWTLLTSSPGWVARERFRAVNTVGHIYVMGGTNAAGTRLNDVWRSADGITWTQQTAAATWSARHSFGAVADGTTVIVAGGNVAAGVVNDVHRSTDGGVTWTLMTASASWSARDGLALVRSTIISTAIWVLGGDAVAAPAGDAWYSTDFGATWRLASSAIGLNNPASVAGWSRSPWLYVTGDATRNTVRTQNGRDWQVYTNFSSSIPTVQDGAIVASSNALISYAAFTASTVIGGTRTRNPRTAWFRGLWPNGFDTQVSPTTDVQLVTFEPIPQDPTNSRDVNDELEGVLVKSRFDAYFYNSKYNTLRKIESHNYPRETVDGAAWLDGRFYVMTTDGRIFGSDISDPFTWSALNFVSAIRHPDTAVGIVRRHNYILAFGVNSMEFFYNTGELAGAVGSTLRRVDSAAGDFGCLHFGSIQQIGGNLIWVGQTNQKRERGLYVLDGYQPRKISTPFIDRILEASDFDCSWSGTVITRGHRLYMVSLCCTVVTLVYDMDMDEWYLWNTERTLRFGPGWTGTGVGSSLTAAIDAASGLVEITVLQPTVITTTIVVGSPVRIEGATQTEYNGLFSVHRIISTTSFTYLLPTSTLPTTPATGSWILSIFPNDGQIEFEAVLTAPVPNTNTVFPGALPPVASKQIALHLFPFPSVVELHERHGSDQYRSSTDIALDPQTHYINFWSRLPKIDFGTNIAKFVSRVEVIGDQLQTKLSIRYSDDDWRTFSNYREVDLLVQRPRLSRQGRTRRRGYDLRHVDTTVADVRIEALEVFGKLGNPS